MSAAELLAQPEEPMRWVWEGSYRRRARAAGRLHEVGKSTLAYAPLAAIAKGLPFLGIPTKRGAVLILALEEHARDVKRRLRRFGLTEVDRVYVHVGPADQRWRRRGRWS